MAQEQKADNSADPTSETSLEQLEEILELQTDILGDISRGKDTKELFEKLCLAAEKLAKGAVASVMFFDRESDQLIVRAAPSIPEQAVVELNGLKPGVGSCGCAVHDNEPQYVRDTFRDERWARIVEFARHYQIQACWSHPVRNESQQPIGSFALSSFEHRSPNSFQRRLLSSCASIAGILFQREASEKQREEYQQRLVESNKYISVAVNSIADGVISTDAQGRIRIFNRAAEQLTGWRKQLVFGKPIDEVFRIAGNENILQIIEPFTESPLSSSREFEELQLTRKSGDLCEIGASVAPINDENGLSGMIIVFWDTAELNEGKRKLEESEARYRSMIENSAESIYLHDAQGMITGVNQKASDLIGYTREELVGMNVSDIEIRFTQDPDVRKILENLAVNNSVTLTGRHRCKDGSEFPVEVCLSCFLEGDKRQFIAMVRDTTDRVRIEKERIKASKLESIGILAGGIAHDFNNLLVGIMGNIDLARMYLDDRKKVDRYLARSADASVRAAELTHQLLTFSRGGDPVKSNADIIEIIRQSCEFVLHGSDVDCSFEFDSNLTTVQLDTSQISQVIQNLIINARQAMEDSGRLLVDCRQCAMDGLDPALGLNAGLYLKLMIKDTGCGIDEENIQSIFDPYFTTKKHGSGLGLAVTYSIVRKHGGRIFAESTAGEGATFTVYLPTGTDLNTEIQQEDSGRPREDRNLLVLVMDDDKLVRQVCVDMLETLGHRCLPVGDGESAIELFRAHHAGREPVDLIIMDLTVPSGMGGKEAMQKILEIDPEARAIVSSGYSHDLVLANHADFGFKGAITKPYTYRSLEVAIKNAVYQDLD